MCGTFGLPIFKHLIEMYEEGVSLKCRESPAAAIECAAIGSAVRTKTVED